MVAMKHTITATASDIRTALAEHVKKHHPDLCKDKTISVALFGEGNHIVATITFEWITSSAWD
jgi:DnaJ-domain-containing protein 1